MSQDQESPQTTTKPEVGIKDIVDEAATLFDSMAIERMHAGAKEYGSFAFLGNDVVRMMMEELVDTSNYCRMQFIKMYMLQRHLETSGLLEEDHGIGFDSFKGTGEGWSK